MAIYRRKRAAERVRVENAEEAYADSPRDDDRSLAPGSFGKENVSTCLKGLFYSIRVGGLVGWREG